MKQPFRNPFKQIAQIFGWGWGSASPYEAANKNDTRSQVPGAGPRDAKDDLTLVRSELVRNSRYLIKNSGFVRELVGNMAIYATGDGIKPQAQTADPAWNKAAEDIFKRWAGRCEVTGRFSFEECLTLICRGMDVDGEYFVLKTRNELGRPSLQLIETHRIGDVDGKDDTIDGVGMSRFGSVEFYRLLLDKGFEDVPASAMLHVFEAESSSAVRTAPTLQHSINHLRDEAELIAMEKRGVKDNLDVTRVIKTEEGEIADDTDFGLDTTEVPADGSDPVTLQRITGGKLVALKPGESLDSFESKRPSATFVGFLEHLRRDSALGVIPYEFAADSSKVGGAGVRLVVAKADRRFSYRQLVLIQRLIQPVWFYVIGDAIASGELPAALNWHKISCVTPRRITVDAGREAAANRADVEGGLKTLTDHFAELGADFNEELRRRATDARAILDVAEEFDVPVQMLWHPSTPITMDTGEEKEPETPEPPSPAPAPAKG